MSDPTHKHRIDTHKLAERIVWSVRNSKDMPLDARWTKVQGEKFYSAASIEWLCFQLAEELLAQCADVAELQRLLTEQEERANKRCEPTEDTL